MRSAQETAIGWIGLVKYSGTEWSSYKKRFTVPHKPDFATIRVDSQGVCGIFVNGQFVESSCGRFVNRISYIEITSLLQEGENEITLELGSHFFQRTGEKVRKRRGSWFSAVAAEVEIQMGDQLQRFTTDEEWQCSSDDGQCKAKLFSHVNQADYERFWKVAALIREPKVPSVPQEILQVAGEEYGEYITKPWQIWAEPEKIIDKALLQKDEKMISSTTYDFGKIQVGHLFIEYEAECDENIVLWFDYYELPEDFGEKSQVPSVIMERLKIKQAVQKGHHETIALRRRATRYLQVQVPEGVQIKSIRFRLSLMPSEQMGWFKCSDHMLNDIWEVGKYTLLVNKHQEYESCPRHEMKYFSGDGIICGLVDYYVFGDEKLVDASLSLTEIECNVGLRPDVYDNNTALWDYPAWRIITYYNQYRYFQDIEFVERYYKESVDCLLWMMHRASNGLIYQYPSWGGPFYSESESVEYSCSFDRLGERPYLNALYYKSLICMAELAEVMNDDRCAGWREEAERVREAFNERLWSEEAGAYLDTYDTSYIPQDGNAVAVLYGLADEKKAKRIFKTLERENWTPYGSTILNKHTEHTLGGADAISPPMCTYEAEARFLNDDAEGALELIHRLWGTMLKKGAGSFWEYAPNDGEKGWPHRCHGWSAGCSYLLSAYVLGIRPGSDGYEVLHFEPQGNVGNLCGVVPTAKGLVAVKCTINSNEKQYELAIPKGIKLEAVLPEYASLNVIEYEEEEEKR